MSTKSCVHRCNFHDCICIKAQQHKAIPSWGVGFHKDCYCNSNGVNTLNIYLCWWWRWGGTHVSLTFTVDSVSDFWLKQHSLKISSIWIFSFVMLVNPGCWFEAGFVRWPEANEETMHFLHPTIFNLTYSLVLLHLFGHFEIPNSLLVVRVGTSLEQSHSLLGL